MSLSKKLFITALCAATFSGTLGSFSAPAEAQYRSRGYYASPGYRAPYYRSSRGSRGGAVAAGVVGGLALGALAAGAASNAYAAPVAPGYAYPAYSRPAHYGGDCYEVRRRYVDDWGRPFTRRETVCE